MKLLRTSRLLPLAANYLLLACLSGVGGVLLGSFFRLVAFTAFALLLFFVVGRSRNFLKTVTLGLRVLPSAFFSSDVTPQWVRARSTARLVLPDEPLRASLFQRPPPPYSL